MPQYFLKQPDGLLALFSSVSDDIKAWNFSEEEALDYGVEEWGRRTAEEKVKRAVDDEPVWPGQTEEFGYGDGLGRWRETLGSIAFQHGMDKVRERLEKMGFADYEIPQSVIDNSREAMGIDDDEDGNETEAALQGP